jgi:uncharacterized Tic20 family protein
MQQWGLQTPRLLHPGKRWKCKKNVNFIPNKFNRMATQNLMGEDFIPPVAPTSDEKTLAVLAHILTLVSSILAPLVIYLIKKDDSYFVSEHAKESLNFQITMIILYIISAVLVVILIGILLLWLLWLANLVLVCIACLRASESKIYRYPINFRLIK